MVKIPIAASTPYEVTLGHSDSWMSNVSYWEDHSVIWVITDETVNRLHGEAFHSQLHRFTDRIVWSVVEPGDGSKSLQTIERLVEQGLREGCDRHTLIIAFGGGMIGDLAGFLANVFMRGVPYIQVPTTVLAHDSAVGGKVAVNHPLAKNAIGAFYQPLGVHYNVSRLETLTPLEVRSGLGELIKHAYLSRHVLESSFEVDLFNALESEMDWVTWLAKGIDVKRTVVEQDEREQGIRAWLNFGHTFGHALESVEKYRLPHGESILYGMVFAFLLSGDAQRAASLKKWMDEQDVTPVEWKPFEAYLEKMTHDKKNRKGVIRFVLLRDEVVIEPVQIDRLQATFEKMKEWWT